MSRERALPRNEIYLGDSWQHKEDIIVSLVSIESASFDASRILKNGILSSLLYIYIYYIYIYIYIYYFTKLLVCAM